VIIGCCLGNLHGAQARRRERRQYRIETATEKLKMAKESELTGPSTSMKSVIPSRKSSADEGVGADYLLEAEGRRRLTSRL
jgi:hypothetical protein